MRYLTLDDEMTRLAATEDPVGMIRAQDRAVIDEIQRAPQLLLAIKKTRTFFHRLGVPTRLICKTGADDFGQVIHKLVSRIEPRLAQVVELRYFVGLTEAEIASALELTDRTVRRDWEKARLLLAEALA